MTLNTTDRSDGDASTPETPPYRPAVVIPGMIITSGQVGIDPETGHIPETVEEQTNLAIDNLERALQDVGASLADVVKTTCILSDISDMQAFNAVYKARFLEPRPARTTVQAGLIPRFLVEIDAWAVQP